ncbi:MAG: TDP-N-acetylfucosamine:lipid II N-acetylfucosaminyltransferase [Bacteroidia bacterium]|nr:TDP-N-acetylfucosamine:lipid II N-acetylfucosaminyltransferase [Bacteroidia bacterium]
MLVHFVEDEIIIDQIIDNFLEISDQNHFIVFGRKLNADFIHITRVGAWLSSYDEKLGDINEMISTLGARAIILHSLPDVFANIILEIQKNIPICWCVWGSDLYGLPKIKPNTYAPLTKWSLLKSKPYIGIEQFIKKHDLLRKIYFEKIKRTDDYYNTRFTAISKISYFSTYIKEDYEVFNKYYPNNLEFITSAFLHLDQYLAGSKDVTLLSEAGNILIGNANKIESNYLDAITVVAKKVSHLKKVYVVLSYGENDSHKKEVINKGRKMLNVHFHPLLDFMERDEYLKMLQSCSVGIFNHYRQQAMGNIIAMLYLGARVYLSFRNPAYRFFLRNGILVNSLENEFDNYGISRLSNDVVEGNRSQLYSMFNKKKVLADLGNLTRVVTNTQCQ